MKRTTPSRRGSAAVEFGVTLPLLMLIVMGIIELGSYMNAAYLVNRSVRDGCRMGAMVLEGPEPTGEILEAAALEQVRQSLAAGGLDCQFIDCQLDAEWFEDHDEWWRLRVQASAPVPGFVSSYVFATSPFYATGEFVMLTRQQGSVLQP